MGKIVYCVVCGKEFTTYPGWQPIYEEHVKTHGEAIGRKEKKRNRPYRRG